MYDSNTSQSAARKPKGGDLKARATSEQDAPITCDLRVCLARPAHGELALAMHGITAHTNLQRQEGIPTRGHTTRRSTTTKRYCHPQLVRHLKRVLHAAPFSRRRLGRKLRMLRNVCSNVLHHTSGGGCNNQELTTSQSNRNNETRSTQTRTNTRLGTQRQQRQHKEGENGCAAKKHLERCRVREQGKYMPATLSHPSGYATRPTHKKPEDERWVRSEAGRLGHEKSKDRGP